MFLKNKNEIEISSDEQKLSKHCLKISIVMLKEVI